MQKIQVAHDKGRKQKKGCAQFEIKAGKQKRYQQQIKNKHGGRQEQHVQDKGGQAFAVPRHPDVQGHALGADEDPATARTPSSSSPNRSWVTAMSPLPAAQAEIRQPRQRGDQGEGETPRRVVDPLAKAPFQHPRHKKQTHGPGRHARGRRP